MCLNPTLIRNPWYHSKTGKQFKKDIHSQYIPVPCGHCSECIGTRAFGIQQRCELEELSGYPFMVYLSYSPDMIPKVTLSNGKVISYADFQDVVKMFKRLRVSNAIGRPFRYLVVSERGKNSGRPHFHMLLYVKRLFSDTVYTPMQLEAIVSRAVYNEWKRNVSKSKKFPVWKPLSENISYRKFGKNVGTFGCHYVDFSSGVDGTTTGATKYVTKYFLKRDSKSQRLQQYLKLNFSSNEYEEVWNKVRTRAISSLNFGFGFLESYNAKKVSRSQRLRLLSDLPSFKHLKDSLSRSISNQESPKYYSIQDGHPLPLSRYFYHIDNLYTKDVYDYFKDLNNKFGDFVQIDERSIFEKLDLEKMGQKRLDNILNKTDIIDLL